MDETAIEKERDEDAQAQKKRPLVFDPYETFRDLFAAFGAYEKDGRLKFGFLLQHGLGAKTYRELAFLLQQAAATAEDWACELDGVPTPPATQAILNTRDDTLSVRRV